MSGSGICGSLLVAPIFNEKGKGIFYLPKGTWTDFLTGETLIGAGWYEKEYDYLHLPLFVKENSIIAIGSVNDRPDYDYAKNAELRIYSLTENVKASCVVSGMDHQTDLKLTAVKNSSIIRIQAEASKPYAIRLVNTAASGAQGADLHIDGADTVLVPMGEKIEVKL